MDDLRIRLAGLKRFASVSILALCALAMGCASERYREFRGTVAWSSTQPAQANVLPLGGGFRSPGISGFYLGQSNGVLVFVYDQPGPAVRQVRTEDISEVYLVTWSFDPLSKSPWQAFFSAGSSERAQMTGVHRLRGVCKIAKWKLDGDIHIELAMTSDDASAVQVNGALMSYQRLTFQPMQYAVGFMLLTGLHPSLDVKPPPPPPASGPSTTTGPVER